MTRLLVNKGASCEPVGLGFLGWGSSSGPKSIFHSSSLPIQACARPCPGSLFHGPDPYCVSLFAGLGTGHLPKKVGKSDALWISMGKTFS